MDIMQAVAKMLEGKKATNDYLKNAGFFLILASHDDDPTPRFRLNHLDNKSKPSAFVTYGLTLADVTSVWELVD